MKHRTSSPKGLNSVALAQVTNFRIIIPSELKKMIEKGHRNDIIQLYEEIEIPFDNDTRSIPFVCVYIDDEKARFVMKDCYDEGIMNSKLFAKTGYYGSAGREHVLKSIYSHMDEEWKKLIIPRKLRECIDGKMIEYSDPMWLPSATDIFGDSPWTDEWDAESDSFQLPVFEGTPRGRVKEFGNRGIYPYWLRTVCAHNQRKFMIVNQRGLHSHYEPWYSKGFAPGFDI